jgi:hypothetical protein
MWQLIETVTSDGWVIWRQGKRIWEWQGGCGRTESYQGTSLGSVCSGFSLEIKTKHGRISHSARMSLGSHDDYFSWLANRNHTP